MFHAFPKEEAYKYYKEQGLADVDAMEKAEYVQDRIVKAGERAVMQNDNYISKKIAVLERFLDSKDNPGDPLWKLGDQLVRALRTLNMPYVKIPLNVAWNLYNLANPYMAFIQSGFYASKAGYDFAHKNGIDAKKSVNSSKDWFVHGAVGVLLNMGTIYLINQGLVNERSGDETKRQRSGESLFGRSNTINMSGLRRLMTGGNPMLKDGDLLVDLQWLGVMGNLINVNANTETERKKMKDDNDEMSVIDEIGATLKNSSVEALGNGVFSGTNNMIKAINQGGGYLDSWAINMINLGTNFIEPATYAQFSRAMLPEKTTYKAESFWNEIKENQKQRDILFRQFAGRPKSTVSMWGDSIPRESGFKGVVLAMLGFSEQDNNKFGSILYQDFLRTKNEKFFPPVIPNTMSDSTSGKTKKVKLTVDQQMELEKIIGTYRKKYVSPFLYDAATVNGKRYSELSDEEKLDELNFLYKQGYEDGKWDFIDLHPEFGEKN
jgi:hypothetical protein